jgi:hypothetical protein
MLMAMSHSETDIASTFAVELVRLAARLPIAFPEPRLEHLLFGPRGLPIVGEALAATLGPAAGWSDAAALMRSDVLATAHAAKLSRALPLPSRAAATPNPGGGRGCGAIGPDLMRSPLQYPTCSARVHVIASDVDL